MMKGFGDDILGAFMGDTDGILLGRRKGCDDGVWEGDVLNIADGTLCGRRTGCDDGFRAGDLMVIMEGLVLVEGDSDVKSRMGRFDGSRDGLNNSDGVWEGNGIIVMDGTLFGLCTGYEDGVWDGDVIGIMEGNVLVEGDLDFKTRMGRLDGEWDGLGFSDEWGYGDGDGDGDTVMIKGFGDAFLGSLMGDTDGMLLGRRKGCDDGVW
jgi:hypothetical protein